MSKKILFPLLFILTVSLLHADWMRDVSRYFNNNNFGGARNYLEALYEESDYSFKPTLCLLLAYSHERIGDIRGEHRWIVEYFETFWAQEIITHYLSPNSRGDIKAYLNHWQQIYPHIADINLLQPHDLSDRAPPDKLVLALDVQKKGFYKLFHKEKMIKGGYFGEGFNTLAIPTAGLFEKTGHHKYLLEFKVGKLILVKEIEFDIQVDEPLTLPQQKKPHRTFDHELSLYVEGRRIASSLKHSPAEKPDDWGGDKKVPYVPVTPPKESNMRSSSFSIFSALGLAAQLIKGLAKKDIIPSVPPPLEVKMMTLTYTDSSDAGGKKELHASIRLKLSNKELKIFQ